MVAILENILWLLVLIGVMIMIHELGHFWAARYFDVKVEAFSLGFGPRLFGFRHGETDYRVSAILIGGYVKMAGDAAVLEQVRADSPAALALPEGSAADSRSLLAKPRWQRVIISAAGPIMNVVLAIAILTGLYMFKYQKISDEDLYAVIDHVEAGSPAAQAGNSGWRPHRQARWQAQPHLGRHRREGSHRRFPAPVHHCRRGTAGRSNAS